MVNIEYSRKNCLYINIIHLNYIPELNHTIPTIYILKIKNIIIEDRYSRIPVYEGTVAHVVGILHTRDYLERLADGKAPDVKELMQPPYFVFKTQQLSKILNAFKRTKIHLAVVTDEYGGTLGIVTMEDLLEEIVGEINDEYDEEERTYVKISENVYIFEGKTLLSDFYKLAEIDPDDFESVAGDADTLACLLLELKGEFPILHEVINFDRYRFEILEMDARRIVKVKVTVGKKTEKEKEE